MLVRLISLSLLLVSAMWAQTASLTGRITDPSGAVIPDARVTVRSTGSGVATTAVSNGDGYYALPSLQPGRYDVEIARDGFVVIRQLGLELVAHRQSEIHWMWHAVH